jgi:arylsulfatase A-like enzyme
MGKEFCRRGLLRVIAALFVWGLAQFGFGAWPLEAGSLPKPNFVVILTDDLGYGDLSCYGSTTIRTPRLDRMAEEGVRLTDFYVTAATCSPSRASLLTGRYPLRAGVPSVLFPTEAKGLPLAEVTLADLLQSQGYATACVGKWHLGHLPPLRPHRRGFDLWFGLPYANDTVRWKFDEPFHHNLAPIELPLMRGDEVIESPVNQETLTERYTAEALAFIGRNKDRPFFVYLAHTFPHMPLYVSARFAGKSRGGLYGDTVECIDWSVGQILDALVELHLDQRTLVMFTSDNGPAGPGRKFGRRGGGGSAGPLRGGKFSTFEGGHRVPAIFRWPQQIPAGRVLHELATTLDLLPTFVKLAGGQPPADRTIDGKDIWPLLSGRPGASSPYSAFYCYQSEQLQAVRVGQWKLFLPQSRYPESTSIMYRLDPAWAQSRFPLRPKPVLYDLDNDLAESRDVAEEHPDVVERLTEMAHTFDRELQADKRPEQVIQR